MYEDLSQVNSRTLSERMQAYYRDIYYKVRAIRDNEDYTLKLVTHLTFILTLHLKNFNRRLIMKNLKIFTITILIIFSSLTNFTYAETLTFSYGTYEGETKKGKAHGLGVFTFLDGTIYEGKFKKNKLHGQGKYTITPDDFIEGKFKRGTLKKKIPKEMAGGQSVQIVLKLELGEIKKN